MIIDPEIYTKAFHDTAEDMTEDLRKEALSHGWHPDVVNNMHVKYSDDDGFTVKVHPDFYDRAFMHEFGSPGNQPTAVIRKYSNKDNAAHEVVIKHLEKHAG